MSRIAAFASAFAWESFASGERSGDVALSNAALADCTVSDAALASCAVTDAALATVTVTDAEAAP